MKNTKGTKGAQHEGHEDGNMKHLALVVGIVVAVGSLMTGQAPASGEWPQWRGPERSGVSRETGLLKQWPKGGPPLAWSAADLGGGYGSVAVAGSRVFVQGMRGRDSVITSLNRADGKVAP